jgi:hypothetical protein
MTKAVCEIGLAGIPISPMKTAYDCGYQRPICGIIIPYQKPGKVFIYFASERPLKIYRSQDMQLKNKNIFATMISDDGAHSQFFPSKSHCDN